MFGMGFTEILLIAVIAILFLGPDKLPGAMIEIAKFFRNAKSAIGSVKDTLEEEIDFNDIKQEALAYKNELENAATQIGNEASYLNDTLVDDDISADFKKAAKKEKDEEVTFEKKKKIEDA